MPTPSATTLTAGESTTNGATFVTASFAGAANALVLMEFVQHAATLRSISSIVGGGASAGWSIVTQRTFSTLAAPLERVEVWRYLTSSPAAASVATITLSGTASNGQWGVTQFSNVSTAGTNGANAVTQSVVSNADTVSGLTCILASFTSSVNVPYGVISFSTTVDNVITVGANFTKLVDSGTAEHVHLTSEWSTVQNTLVDGKLTAGTRNAGGIAMEIAGDNPAAAGVISPYYAAHYYPQIVMGVA